jgi:hypothetical protein
MIETKQDPRLNIHFENVVRKWVMIWLNRLIMWYNKYISLYMLFFEVIDEWEK